MRLALLLASFALLSADAAYASCGESHVSPAGGQVGTAPLAVGDSVMLGAAPQLGRSGFEVDAVCGRSPRGGLHLLQTRRRKGTLPEIVVMALGTNIFITSRDIRRMLRTLGRSRTLMLVTPLRSWRPVSGAPMRRAARRRPRRVKLIDWSSRARRNRHWVAGDGTHLTATGRRAYTRLLIRAAWSRQRGRIVRRNVITRGRI